MPDNAEGSPIVNMEGRLVALGPVDTSMLPLFQRWLNDLDVQRRLGRSTPGPMTAEDERQWYDSLATNQSTQTFAIRDRATMAVVGNTSLHGIDLGNRCAVFGILIGDPGARGRGLGTETTTLMLRHAFDVLGLHSVSLVVAEFNPAGIAAYRKAGFRESGRLREAIRFDGRWWDQIQMDCLEQEFRGVDR